MVQETKAAIQVKLLKSPLYPNKKCSVQMPASYGSYIYQAPSKYDLVFWPKTSANGIWFCKASGFTAFGGDFKGLTKKEKKVIKKYLKSHIPKNNDIKTKLKLLESLYALRNKDNRFNNSLLRVLAYWYESLHQYKKANKYRQLALKDMEKQLTHKLDEEQELEYLYLLTNYSKQLGKNQKSNKYLKRLKKRLKHLKNDNSKGFKEYITEFISDSKYIKKGGKLAPKLLKHK